MLFSSVINNMHSECTNIIKKIKEEKFTKILEFKLIGVLGNVR